MCCIAAMSISMFRFWQMLNLFPGVTQFSFDRSKNESIIIIFYVFLLMFSKEINRKVKIV